MRRVRATTKAHQPACETTPPLTMPLDEGAVTRAIIQALIPLGLRTVEEALQQEVTALASRQNRRQWNTALPTGAPFAIPALRLRDRDNDRRRATGAGDVAQEGSTRN